LKKNHKFFLLITFVINISLSKDLIISFYNVENLFDIYDSEDTNDYEFTPRGSKNYTQLVYNERLENISSVIRKIGNNHSVDGPAVIGLAEIENRIVLKDLISHPNLIDKNYSVVHYDSPDTRGIDVALLYQSSKFEFVESKKFKVELIDQNGLKKNTRDILLVSGKLNNENIHFIVNHWPSRSGGKSRTIGFRKKAALTAYNITDSILADSPKDHIIIMGDFNDNPTDESLTKILKAFPLKNQPKQSLVNLYVNKHKKGIGTNVYRGEWNLFDQIIISKSLISTKRSKNMKIKKFGIYNKPYLIHQTGKYKSYPYRAFGGHNYIGGYSDHFPVYIILEIK